MCTIRPLANALCLNDGYMWIKLGTPCIGSALRSSFSTRPSLRQQYLWTIPDLLAGQAQNYIIMRTNGAWDMLLDILDVWLLSSTSKMRRTAPSNSPGAIAGMAFIAAACRVAM